MIESTFRLRPEDEYIELIKLLKLEAIAQSGGQAKAMVEDGLVEVNGVKEFRKRNKLRAGDTVKVDDVVIEIIDS